MASPDGSPKVSDPASKSREATQDQLPPPNAYFQENPAMDGRKLRRIIAEDPEWNLMTVPLLTEICIGTIVKYFATNPRHDELLERHRKKVLKQLPTSLPLKITSHLIDSEEYWERCCKDKWKINDVSKFGNKWKRLYFEKSLQAIVENFVPNQTDKTKLMEIVQLGAPYVHKLDVRQLLPPVEVEKKAVVFDDEDDEEEKEEEPKEEYDCDHFDFNLIVPQLHKLEEMHVSYGLKECGMNFAFNLFEFTKRDCQMLSKCVFVCKALRVLHLNWSKIDDDKVRLLISQILDHPALEELNLEHNQISDRGARAIGKFINGHSKLINLNLCNNLIKAAGAQAIAHALIKNQTLKFLNLRLNRLGDDGGQAIAKALLKNNVLVEVNLACNNMTEPTAALIAMVVSQNRYLRKLDLSSNRLGPDGGKQIQEAMQDNKSLIEVDLRLTECGQESEYIINQILKKNQDLDRASRIDEQNKIFASMNRTFSHIF